MNWKIQPKTNSDLWNHALLSRGLETPESIKSFLEPSLKDLCDPFLLPNIKRAANRIIEAIKAKETIAVFGDYDCDGVTSVVVLCHTIKMYGGIVGYYIPDREEGYGLHEQSMATTIEGGAKLLISVDCGITAIEPAALCKERGIDLIITDHHEAKETFPDCYAIVHPKYNVPPGNTQCFIPSDYPNINLCGSGVAFQLSLAIGKLLNDGVKVATNYSHFFVEALAFTALGTIADVVPLVGENRAIAYWGMKRIPKTPFVGLHALAVSAGFGQKEIDGYTVGFSLAPRINAAGRMGHASLAVKMLASENYDEALIIAERLEKQNKSRQEEERKIVKQAEIQYQQLIKDNKPTDIIIINNREWHPGVVGIVASRLAEKYHKPAIVFVRDGGSGRSVEGFSIIDACNHAAEFLTRYGGHNAACGLHIKDGCLEKFRDKICTYAKGKIPPPTVRVEAEAKLSDMTLEFVEKITKLGPFGNGNTKPVFLFKNISITSFRKIGKENQFCMFMGRQNDVVMKFVSFKEVFPLTDGDICDIIAEPILNEYKGNISVELQIKDLRLDKGEVLLYNDDHGN